jgi:pSer/pThr/pTyr-binding forkhead associated (FHA) protein
VKAELVMHPSGLLLSLERKKTFIGRNPDNDIVIEEPHVSHKHCIVLNTSNGFFIEDLASSNGTSVNGQKIKGKVRLRNNDILTFGGEYPAYQFRLLSGIVSKTSPFIRK